jgi:hypothetical protein
MRCAAGVELNPAELGDAPTRAEPVIPEIGGCSTELLAAIAIAVSGIFTAGGADKGGTVIGAGGATTRAGSAGGAEGVSGIPPTSTGLGCGRG